MNNKSYIVSTEEGCTHLEDLKEADFSAKTESRLESERTQKLLHVLSLCSTSFEPTLRSEDLDIISIRRLMTMNDPGRAADDRPFGYKAAINQCTAGGNYALHHEPSRGVNPKCLLYAGIEVWKLSGYYVP